MDLITILSFVLTIIILLYLVDNQYFIIIALYLLCITCLYCFNNYLLNDLHFNNSFISYNLDLSKYKIGNGLLFLIATLFFMVFYFFTYKKDILPILNNKFSLNKEFIERDEEKERIQEDYPEPSKPIPSKPDPEFKCFRSKENPNSDNKLILFYASWCKYSREICLDWEEFVETHQSNNLSILAINCDDYENPPEIASRYNVEGYPTTILHLSNDKKYVYSEKLTANNLSNFIKYICDKEQIKNCL